MLEHKIGGLPVLQNGKLEGLLTESEIFRAFVGLAAPHGELRLTFALSAGRSEAPDPVLIALRLGFRVRGYLEHESPGGEAIRMMRLLGERKQELVAALGQAGYNVIEIADARPADEGRPAA
jgi:CBS domain-containing protein